MKPPRDGIRKAAILVAALDQKAADVVLRRMGPQQAQMVRRMMDELGDVDPRQQRQVIDEFFRVGPMVPEKDPPGIELDGRLARKLSLRPARVSGGDAGEPHAAEEPPFVFLHEAEGDKLSRILAAERPQMIALVLSHLPPVQAGGVLVRLAPGLQLEVVRRLIDLEETAPEILREVERGLRSRLSEQVRMQRRRVAGLSAVTGILEASDPQVSMRIFDNLADRDQALADRLAPGRFEFHDLHALDDVSLQAIAGAAGTELMTLALTGAEAEFVERVLGQFPAAEARTVRRQLAHLGPTRLSDVEEARRRIAALAQRLLLKGRIQPPRDLRKPLAGIGA